MKTNAARLLDEEGVPYQLRQYEVDLEDLTAIKVAGQIGMPVKQVFKTLLAKGDRTGYVLAVVPGDAEVDLKALARVAGNKEMQLAAVSQLQQLTGYVRGAVTALAYKKPFPVFMDETAHLYDVISISAGLRGTQILVGSADYMRVTRATACAITRNPKHNQATSG